MVKRLLVMTICLVALTGCFARTGSYRGIRVAEEGKFEFTPYVGYTDIAGVKVAYGTFERSEIDFGLFVSDTGGFRPAVGADIGAKYLLLDEKTSDDSISLAIGSRVNVPFYGPTGAVLSNSSLDLDLIGGYTFGEYTEDSIPGNIYLGLGPRVRIPFLGRIFVGGEIPISPNLIITPELSALLIPFPYPSAGIGFTFRP